MFLLQGDDVKSVDRNILDFCIIFQSHSCCVKAFINLLVYQHAEREAFVHRHIVLLLSTGCPGKIF